MWCVSLIPTLYIVWTFLLCSLVFWMRVLISALSGGHRVANTPKRCAVGLQLPAAPSGQTKSCNVTPTTPQPRHRTREAGLQQVANANGDRARAVAWAKDREARLRERLQQLAKSDRQRAKKFQRVYLNSYEVILAALAKANEKYRQKHRLPPDGLMRIAQEINAWMGTDEPVRAEMRQKSGGGQRPIAAFGIRNKALQIMAHRAVEPFANLSPYQYAVRGITTEQTTQGLIRASPPTP